MSIYRLIVVAAAPAVTWRIPGPDRERWPPLPVPVPTERSSRPPRREITSSSSPLSFCPVPSHSIGAGSVGDPPRAHAEEERRLCLGALRAASARRPGRQPTAGDSLHQPSAQVSPAASARLSAPLNHQFSQHFRNVGEEQQLIPPRYGQLTPPPLD